MSQYTTDTNNNPVTTQSNQHNTGHSSSFNSQSLTWIGKFNAYLMLKQNMRVQQDKQYRLTSAEQSYLGKCSTPGTLLPYIAFAILTYPNSAGRTSGSSIAAGLGILTAYCGIELIRDYRCVISFTSQPSFPLAIDNRRLLYHSFPQHSILKQLNNIGSDMLAPPLQYGVKADKPTTNNNNQSNINTTTNKLTTQQSKYTNSPTELASQARYDTPQQYTAPSSRQRESVSVPAESLQSSNDNEFISDASNQLDNISFNDDYTSIHDTSPHQPTLRIKQRLTQSANADQPNNSITNKKIIQNNKITNTTQPRVNTWDKIRNRSSDDELPIRPSSTTHQRKHKYKEAELRDQITHNDSTQIDSESLFQPDVNQHIDYDTSARAPGNELLTLKYHTQQNSNNHHKKQQQLNDRRYKQYRPLQQRDELVIDFTAPNKL